MAAAPAPRRKRGGLRRGTLTPDRIVTESLRLLDTAGVAGFSMPKLGRALGADPTAVYRHFASKDELFRTALKSSLEPYSINVVELLSGLDEIEQIRKLVDLYYEFVSQNVYSVRFLLSLVVREEKNLDDLLEKVLLVADAELELTANPQAEASGPIVESRLDVGRGPGQDAF